MSEQPTPVPEKCDTTRYSNVIIQLLACMQQEFKDCQIDLCYLGWMPGAQIDMMHVSDGGSMAWVRVANIEPTIDATNGYHCSTPLTFTLEVGFITCYPIKEEPNTIQEDLELSMAVVDGQFALLRSVLCCDWAKRDKRTLDISTWTPFGPEGGAVGGTWNFSLDATL